MSYKLMLSMFIVVQSHKINAFLGLIEWHKLTRVPHPVLHSWIEFD